MRLYYGKLGYPSSTKKYGININLMTKQFLRIFIEMPRKSSFFFFSAYFGSVDFYDTPKSELIYREM